MELNTWRGYVLAKDARAAKRVEQIIEAQEVSSIQPKSRATPYRQRDHVGAAQKM